MVKATIDVVDRGRMEMDENFSLEANVIATKSNPTREVELETIPVYNLVIDHPEGTILWDTGSHHEAGEGHWPSGLYDAFYHGDAADHRLDDDLEAAGWSLDDVDYVVQTHLHLDHAGGLEFFDGTDVPVFVHEEELKYAYYSTRTSEGSNGYVLADFHHDLNWEVVHGDRERHFEDVEFVRLPGHTPGLMGMLVHLDDHGSVLFTSDHVEIAANYDREIPPGPGLLWGRTEWYDSLHTVQELERRHDAEVVYGHDMAQYEEMRDGWQ
ncbi:MAG: N-acyl homoserine lactonase family protein [Haloarculaceae archaeon]